MTQGVSDEMGSVVLVVSLERASLKFKNVPS